MYQFLKVWLIVIGRMLVDANYRSMLLPAECWKHTRSHLNSTIERHSSSSFIILFLVVLASSCDMADRKQYFLHSGSGEVIQVPIQIQSAEDSAFISEILSPQRVNNSDENSDISSDCEANEDVVVGQSSTEQTVSSESTYANSFPSSSNTSGSSVLEGSTQQVINLQILAQLGSIGKRLDAIEQNSSNKTNDITKVKS